MAVIISCLPSFLSHGPLVPESNAVTVRIDEFYPVSPVGLLWAKREHDATCRPVGKRGIDIGNLEPQSAPIGIDLGRNFLQENREVLAVLQRDGAPVGNFEFHPQAERRGVPF